MNATKKERMWFLRRWWGDGMYNSHPWVGIKRWDAHVAKLVKDGLLEPREDWSMMWRITQKGMDALAAEGKE